MTVRAWALFTLSLGMIALLGFSALASAEETLTPGEVLRRAQVSRFDFDDALLDLKREIPYMRDKTQIDGFLLILSELKRIEQELNYSIFDVSPLTPVAMMLTKAALDHLDLVADPPDLLYAFVRWASNDVRSSFCRMQESRLTDILPRQNYLDVIERLKEAKEILEEPTVEGFQDAVISFDLLQAQAIGGALRLYHRDFLLSDFRLLLTDIRSSDALNPLMDQLQRAIYASGEAASLDFLLKHILVLAERMREFPTPPSFAADARVGGLASEALAKFIARGGNPSTELSQTILERLDSAQIVNLAARLPGMDEDDLLASQYASVATLGELLTSRLENLSMHQEANLLRGFTSALKLGAILNSDNLEGVYEQVMPEGRYQITLARTGATSLAVCFRWNYHGYPVASSASWAQVLADGKTIHVSGVDANQSPASLASQVYIDFVSDPIQHRLRGTFKNGARAIPFDVVKIRDLQERGTSSHEDIRPPTGLFRGSIMGREVSLRVEQTGKSLAGTLTFNPGTRFAVHATLGLGSFQPRLGLLLLSDRGTESGAFLQIRGHEESDRFVGEYIVGDRLESYPFELRREGAYE
jgi:hypothetical protein